MKSKQLKNQMDLENGLYAQVVMIRRSNLDDIEEKDKKHVFNFQGKLARAKHWFNIDHEWPKENFMTCEPDFYKKLYQNKFRGDKKHDYKQFGVLIGNAIPRWLGC